MQNESSKKISFKPLHEGVGFHPFSEGLPYAPQSATPKSEKPRMTAPSITPAVNPMSNRPLPEMSHGIGAMSAGSPTFATPKTTRQLQQAVNQQHANQQSLQNLVQNSFVNPSATSSKPAPARSMASEQTILRKRVFAYLLDTVVHLGFWIAINLVAILGFHIELDGSLMERNWFGFLLFFSFSQWFFISMQELLFETTVGKSFFGLEFKRNRNSFFGSSLLLRSIVFMIGLMAGGLGLFFRPQDKIAEIQLKQS